MAEQFGFKILKESSRSRARLGVIHTPHGDIETPAFVPVATRASIKGLDSVTVAEAGSQLLICNTYHLHLAPGESVVQKAGGLHDFMNWKKPLMTDSGGFQVFSLGFGTDHGVGKILKEKADKHIKEGEQPQKIKITEEGVAFKNPFSGEGLFLGPEESIAIQEALGADIIFAFDECPSPLASEEYMRISVDRTHRWAKRSLDAKKRADQALYGIVQGGASRALREESARVISAMSFEGFGIGGEFGYEKEGMMEMVGWVSDALPKEKPRHLLGIGHPEDFELAAKSGADTFDCIAPTHYARHGMAFTSEGRIDLRKTQYLDEHTALDPNCSCPVCKTYSRAYLAHLQRAHEITGLNLTTLHNIHYFNTLAQKVRTAIGNDEL